MGTGASSEQPLFGRDVVLLQLSEQLDAISKRLKKDSNSIRRQNFQADNIPFGFMTYGLKNDKDEPLSQEYMKKFDITVPAIEKLPAYIKLGERCEKNNLKLQSNFYMNFTAEGKARFLRLVVEGLQT